MRVLGSAHLKALPTSWSWRRHAACELPWSRFCGAPGAPFAPRWAATSNGGTRPPTRVGPGSTRPEHAFVEGCAAWRTCIQRRLCAWLFGGVVVVVAKKKKTDADQPSGPAGRGRRSIELGLSVSPLGAPQNVRCRAVASTRGTRIIKAWSRLSLHMTRATFRRFWLV